MLLISWFVLIVIISCQADEFTTEIQEEIRAITLASAEESEEQASLQQQEKVTTPQTKLKDTSKLIEVLKKDLEVSLPASSEKNKRKSKKVTSPRDPLVAHGNKPRGARFFSSGSSLLSGFVPAAAPPRARLARAPCAHAAPCHTAHINQAIADLVNSTRNESQTQSAVAQDKMESATARKSLPVSEARKSRARSRTQSTTTPKVNLETTTAVPKVSTTTIPVSTTNLKMFRKFKILERHTTPPQTIL